ncbi:MAG: hypothetical protein LBR11_13170 [Deltaproteobacteria bacterium]|nr:hypothetical protein [Deltaproteobacteria bacterium]
MAKNIKIFKKNSEKEKSITELLNQAPLSPYKLNEETIASLKDDKDFYSKGYDNIKDLCKALGIWTRK